MAESTRLPRSLFLGGVVLLLLALAGVSVLTVRRARADSAEESRRKAAVDAGPFVRVAQVQVAQAQRSVTLTAEVRPWQRATLYAKVSGYVKEIRVDKGDKVRRGQLLAVLEAPDTDQAVASARADHLLRTQSATRARTLHQSGYVAQSDVDQADASLKIAQSGLDRAVALRAYEQLRAPFDGEITARYVDTGALLPAATGSTQSAQALVDVADLSRLRVALALGQDDAALVRPGDTATLDLGSAGERKEKVARIAGALDPKTRTMLVEVDVQGQTAGLLPGSFVPVTLQLRGIPHPLVPAEALLIQGGKTLVATLVENRVHLVPVRTGTDDGRQIEILSGLSGGETVALNLGNDAAEGKPVQPVSPTARK